MNFPNKIADVVVKGRWYFFGFFLALIVASLILIPMVGENYDMTKYLPSDSNTKVALEVMTDEFGSSGTASIVVTNAEVSKVEKVATEASKIEGVKNAIFYNNSDYYNSETKAGLIQIFFDHGNYDLETAQALADLRELCTNLNADASFCGDSVDAVASENAITSEMWIILLVAIVIMLGILFLTSRSWIEPLIYLIVIGTSIIINMGSNLIMGEISYITGSISTIMLMAIIMDYCIVLCSRYREESEKGGTPSEIMTRALAGSFNAILACSLTVLVGLVALCFMDFKIGLDLGVVLAKGVAISIFAVLFFMPSVILLFQKPMHTWQHKSFLPRLNKLGTFAHKTRWIMPVIMLALIVSGIVLQQNVTFTYVVDNHLEGSQLAKESKVVEDNFGKQNTLVIMVPKGKIDSEAQLLDDVMSITVKNSDGESVCYIEKAKGFANTGLEKKLTATEIGQTFKLDSDAVAQIYAVAQKTTTESLYTYEVLEILQNNSDIIVENYAQKQAVFDNYYNSLAKNIDIAVDTTSGFNIYSQLNYQDMHDNISTLGNADLSVFQGIYRSILGEKFTETSKLPAYAVILGLKSASESGTISLDYYPKIKTVLTTPTTFAQIYTALDKATLMNKGLLESTVDQIFMTYGATDSIYACQFYEAMHTEIDPQAHKTIMNLYADEIMAQVETNYNSYITAKNMYFSDNYSRMLFNIKANADEDVAIDTIKALRTMLDTKYVDTEIYSEYFVVNSSQNLIDTMDVFSGDRTRTDLITILGVFMLVLLLMRSLSIPVLLVFLIQGAIWINLAVGTLFGESIFFVCYLLAMVIQMGATIDYAILMTDRYVFFRKTQGKQEAIKTALNSAFPTVITSGTILIVAAYSIHFISSLPLLKSIGGLIGRGALISVIAVMFVLPSVLLLFDKVICKTTLKADFLDDKKNLIIVEPETVNGAPVEGSTLETKATEFASEPKKVSSTDSNKTDKISKKRTTTASKKSTKNTPKNTKRTNKK